MWQNKTFVNDNGYSNFSARSIRQINEKLKSEADNTKSAEAEKKQDTPISEKSSQQQLDTPLSEKKSYKVPMIIGGILLVGVVSLVLIKKLRK